MQTHYREVWSFLGFFLDKVSKGDRATTHLWVSQCHLKPESPISSKMVQYHVNEFLETDRMDNNLLLVFWCKCLIRRNFFVSKWLLALNIQQNLNWIDVKWLDLPVKGFPLNCLRGVCQKTHVSSFLCPFCPIWKNPTYFTIRSTN